MQTPTSFWSNFIAAVNQRAQRSEPRPTKPWPANPFPSGIQPGSGAHRALLVLEAVAPDSLTAGEIFMAANVTRDALKRGLAELVRRGLATAHPDPRNPRWHRYELQKAKSPTLRVGLDPCRQKPVPDNQYG